MRRSTGWLDLTGLSPPLDGLALVMPLLLGVVLLHHDLLLGAAAIGGDGRLGNGDAAPAIIAVGRRRIGVTRMRHPVMGHDHAGYVVVFIICTFIIGFRRARLVILRGIGSDRKSER